MNKAAINKSMKNSFTLMVPSRTIASHLRGLVFVKERRVKGCPVKGGDRRRGLRRCVPLEMGAGACGWVPVEDSELRIKGNSFLQFVVNGLSSFQVLVAVLKPVRRST